LEEDKTLILNLHKGLSQDIEEVLSLDVLEVVHTIEDLNDRSPFYIIKPEGEELEANPLFKDSRVLRFDNVGEVTEFLRKQGDVIFNPELANTDIGKVILKRFFTRSAVVQMESAYEDILQKSFSTKFSNPLTVGYYTDIVTKFAHEERADITGLRTFLSAASSFFVYLAKEDIGWFPLDVDYGVTDDALVVQITAPVSKVYKDYVLQSLLEEESSNPFVGLIDVCAKQSHALDFYYLEKSNKLIFTGIWLKDSSIVGKGFFPSMLINQLYTYEELRDLRKNNITSKIKLAQDDVEVSYSNIPGSVSDTYEDKGVEESRNLLNIKKLVQFIKKYRETEEDAVLEDEMNLRDIGKYLRKYPDQTIISQLEQKDREVILKCFKNENMAEEVEEAINTVKSGLDKEEFLQTILDNLTELEVDDVVNISNSTESLTVKKVKGIEDVVETINKVNGAEEEAEYVQKIAGSEKKKDDHKIVISSSEVRKSKDFVVKSLGGEAEEKGVLKFKSLETQETQEDKKRERHEEVLNTKSVKTEQEATELGNVCEETRARNKRKHDQEELILSGEWEAKKRKIAAKISENLEKIKNGEEVASIEGLEEELQEVFKEELGSEELGGSVAKGIADNSSEKLISERLDSVQRAKEKIEEEKTAQIISMKDEQIIRMKKIVDTIKTENSSLKTKLYEDHESGENENISSTNAKDSKEFKILKGSVDGLNKEISIKDIAYENLKESQSVALENKDKQLKQLENRLNSVLDTKSKNSENNLASEMKKISNENRLLQSQIEFKDRTVENMSRRIEMSKQDGNHKENVELERVKEQNKVALEAMKAFKIEKAALELKLRSVQREAWQKETEATILKGKESKPGVDESKELRAKDKEIQTIKIENGKISDQTKAITIRCKQLEQKMKFLNAQVESVKKVRGGMSSKSPSSGREANLALKLKQLETSREKMTKDTQRLSTQLDGKKKEAVQLTTENNILKNKMAELEQKLNKIESKAS
jgi:hypothetical protein